MASGVPHCPSCPSRPQLQREPDGTLRCPECQGRFAAPIVSSSDHEDTIEPSYPIPEREPRPLNPASTPGDLPFSDAFLNNYELVSFLGKGAMGTVYLMKQVSLARLVAVKVVQDDSVTADVRARLVKEAQVLAALQHDNVMAIYEAGVDGTMPFMVSEYIKGETLGDRLKRAPRLTLVQGLKIIMQILDGMRAAHKQGIVHRDLKPANIFMGPSNKAKIGDFGLAKSQSLPSGTSAGRIMGTPGYMSPEQCRGATATLASDIYSIGIMLFEVLTGERPYKGPTLLDFLRQHTREEIPDPRSVDRSLPAELHAIIQRATEKDPGSRYKTCLEFKKAIQELLRAQTSPPKRDKPAAVQSHDIGPGAKLADRYELVSVLGQGGMGQVWLAKDHVRDGVEVAVKILPPELWRDAEARASIIHEANLSLKLAHPDIVRILNVEPGESPFIVMELVLGPTLSAELARRKTEDLGPMPPEDVLVVLEPVAYALQYAHERDVIHRDIKPSNLILEMPGGVLRGAKLADFGIAAELASFKTRMTGVTPMGTLSYMSPEQVLCRKLDARSDVYSLGATLYQMLTFRPPFVGGDIAHAIRYEAVAPPDEVSPALGALVVSSLAKNPDERPSSAAEFASRLRAAVGSSAPPFQSRTRNDMTPPTTKFDPVKSVDFATPVTLNQTGAVPGTTRRAVRGLAWVGVLALCGIAAWMSAQRPPPRDEGLVARHRQRDSLLQEAGKQFDEASFDAALESYSKAGALDDTHVETHRRRALCLNALDRAADAVAPLERALALAPDDPRVKATLAAVLLRLEQTDRAVQLAADVARTRQDDSGNWITLGHAYKKLGQRNDARDAFRRALTINPRATLVKAQLDELD